MTLLHAKGITKKFPGVTALDKVDLVVDSGEVHCIVGENGAGKSTLVKVLTGLYAADEGFLSVIGKQVSIKDNRLLKTVAYVPQELNLFENLSVAENLFIPFDKSSKHSLLFNKKKCEIMSLPYLEKLKMKAKPQDLVKDITIAERQLLQVARALSNDKFKVLILDEPTASLTNAEIDRLFSVINILKKEGKAVILITHKLDEVFQMNDKVTVLRNGIVAGNAKVDEVDKEWIIKKMTGKEIDLDKKYRPSRKAGEIVLDVKHLSGKGFKDISFSLREGEILGFAGLVGAGRSEIMETIFGYLPEEGGTVEFRGKPWKFRDPGAAIANGLIYLSEERKTHGILPNLSVRHNISAMLLSKMSTLGVLNAKTEQQITERVITNYNIKTSSLETKIMNLSGGNQQKVLIGRTMEASPRVLFFDEPTRGIDVGTKEEIYTLMKKIAEEERVGIVLISSELEELLKCANRIVTIYEGHLHGELLGEELTMGNILSSVIGM